MSIEKTYIQYGVPSNWAHNYELQGIAVDTFRITSKRNLKTIYKISVDQVDFVKDCLKRKPIPEKVLDKLLDHSNHVCCICKGTKGTSYIIHHIEEYSKTQDNSYSNLAVLCPNDHDDAHKQGKSLTMKLTPDLIRKAKKKWEKESRTIKIRSALAKHSSGRNKDWKKVNPFKELQSYLESDKEYFFGRQEEKKELTENLLNFKIVGLFGESGTGKTSLINAGIIPLLKDDGIITVSVRCLDEPIKRIRQELFAKLKENNIAQNITEDLAVTTNFPQLVIKLKSIVDKENLSIIIVIDQFEEIFTRANELEREQLANGIIEALVTKPTIGSLYFLLSIREDYIGDIWDWSHQYKIQDAWLHQYRIKRLTDQKALDAIVDPLTYVGINVDKDFARSLVSELKKIGDNLIYPPYLQILCSKLFDEYKKQNFNLKSSVIFGKDIYNGQVSVEEIISDYLSESMLEGLTQFEQLHAQNILNLLTGPEGLRNYLTPEEISRYLAIPISDVQHVIGHLISKKIVHAVLEDNKVKGYELVHDFLSKKFFEKLDPDAQRKKTVFEIFRIAFREYKQHEVLASKDRLEMFLPKIKQLPINNEEWFFLIKSSFSVYWFWENSWTAAINHTDLAKICLALLNDENDRIVQNAIQTLGKLKHNEAIPFLIDIIKSPDIKQDIKEAAISQFSSDLIDKRAISPLKDIIKNNSKSKLRKYALYSFGKTLKELSKTEPKIISSEINVILEALDDSSQNVRKQAADTIAFDIQYDVCVTPLCDRLKIESSVTSRKSMVLALGLLLQSGIEMELISRFLEKLYARKKEDIIVKNEIKYVLRHNAYYKMSSDTPSKAKILHPQKLYRGSNTI
jgi:hypothetical protein